MDDRVMIDQSKRLLYYVFPNYPQDIGTVRPVPAKDTWAQEHPWWEDKK